MSELDGHLVTGLGADGFGLETMLSPISPHLQLLDYHNCTRIEEQACAVPHSNMGSIIADVNQHWNQVTAADLKKVCSIFRSRIEAVIGANGGIFEK